MPRKPIVLLAHPRSCSTAFERMFLTRRDDITCIHEPFCDAYHFGPERLSERYTEEQILQETGYANSTYGAVLDNIWRIASEGKRVFIKDMAKSLIPPSNKPIPELIPPSLRVWNGVDEGVERGDAGQFVQDPKRLANPTVVPHELLIKLHFTFLIRHPCLSIPSLYEISTPPVSDTTGWHGFHPDDVGLAEMRKLFDYLVSTGLIGPKIAGGQSPGGCHPSERDTEAPDICVVDAEELLSNPEKVCETYCRSVGVPFNASMLRWDSAGDQERAESVFQKSLAQHTAALESASFKHSDLARIATQLSPTEQDEEWERKYGSEGAEAIRDQVDKNIADYEYLKQFAIRG